jgi:hypothetical protein
VHGGAYLWEDVPECVGNVTNAANTFPSSLKAFYKHIGSDKTLWAHNGKVRVAAQMEFRLALSSHCIVCFMVVSSLVVFSLHRGNTHYEVGQQQSIHGQV